MANRLRTDNLEQQASQDSNAPNMLNGSVIDGDVKFIYSLGEEDKLAQVKDSLGWDFSDSKENKELNLTHNLIAPKAGFPGLMLIYDGDKILDYRDRIKSYIKTKELADDFSSHTFGEVIQHLMQSFPEDLNRINPTPAMKRFIDDAPELFERAKRENYEIFRRIYLTKDALIDDKKKTILMTRRKPGIKETP